MLKYEYRRRSFDKFDLNYPVPNVEELVLENGDSVNEQDSGYSSLKSTPSNENPPFDWLVPGAGDIETNEKYIGTENSMSPPNTFGPIIIQEPDILYSGQPIKYKIDLGETIYYSTIATCSIKTFVIPPCGIPIPVQKEFDHSTGFLICTFTSYENGIHKVYVKTEENDSTFQMNIGRNYKNLNYYQPKVEIEMEHGYGNNSRFIRKPWGITVDPKKGTIYGADRERNEIIAYAAEDGQYLFSFGSLGYGAGEFYRPTAVAFDPIHNRLYVTDKDNHRVQYFSPTGTYLGSFGQVGQNSGELLFPWGICVSPDGNIIAVADSGNHRLQMFTKDGLFLRKFYPRAKRGSEHMNHADIIGWQYPRGLSFDGSGEYLYVSDFNGHVVFKLHASFTHYESFAYTGLDKPSGIAVDEIGNVLICDNQNNAIKIYSSHGQLMDEIRNSIEQPTDLAILQGGNLVTLDCNSRIRIA